MAYSEPLGGLSTQGTQVNAAPQRINETARELSRLSESIERLEYQSKNLIQKLEIVLRPETPNTDQIEKKLQTDDPTPSTQLARGLRELEGKINNINRILVDTERRLEI